MLTLYNSLTKREEEFRPLTKGTVTMYTCGPTVYGRPHIGNYSSFLMADLLRRWLEVSGYSVISVKNITDVGHLVADADEGEDKIEKQARTEQVDPLAIAKKYTNQYLADEKALNILDPTHRPKATETIQEQLEMIKTLMDKGHAYETNDGYYFSVESFEEYGKLSGNTIDQLHSGARIAVDDKKRHPADFALWKKCTGENSHHILRWSYETGERVEGNTQDASAGFPGWHIECSAMSRSLLGDQIDIHTGGEDLIFPHHECEIAQSECCSGNGPFVGYWLHKRFIDLGDAKMSKSTGHFLTLDDVVEKGFSPQDLRYYLLSVHYRTQLKFTWEGMEAARKARRRIMEWMLPASTPQPPSPEEEGGQISETASTEINNWKQKFTDAMDSDLNTPAALAVAFELMAWARNEGVEGTCGDLMEVIRETFGCFEPEEESIPTEVQALVDKREEAREQKNFEESDRLRDEIASLGYEVRDEAGGQKVCKV